MVYEDRESHWFNPPALYRPAPFWSWNGKLVPKRLIDQIKTFKEVGFGGFFIHSRYGLKTEYFGDMWFKCIDQCLDYAQKNGMKGYLYDEDRWPSGTASGALTRNSEDYRMRFLCIRESGNSENTKDHRLCSFVINFNEKKEMDSYRFLNKEESVEQTIDQKIMDIVVIAESPSPWYHDGTYLDTMNNEAVRKFIEVTYEVYDNRYSEKFGELIPAIFTDEPTYGFWSCGKGNGKFHVPWTKDFLREFKIRRGYDILGYLPEVVFCFKGRSFSKVKYDFYRTLTELFVENYTKQIGLWCEKHNIALTGHLLLEDSLVSQVSAVGACMPHYEYMGWPGIDLLGDNTIDLAMVKQCTSVADQLGKKRALCESFGANGWDWPLSRHKYIANWLFSLGINFLCVHHSHYTLTGGAKRDWPLSFSEHNPWWKYYDKVQNYFSRLSFLLSQGQPIRDVLVIHPIESAWGLFNGGAFCEGNPYDSLGEIPDSDPVNEMNKSLNDIIFTLSDNNYDWDFADESLLAKYGQVKDKTIKVGEMSYKFIIIPPCVTLRLTTVKLLRKFQEVGGQILFVKPTPSMVDSCLDSSISRFVLESKRCDLDQIINTLRSDLGSRISIKEKDIKLTCIWSMLRKVDDGQILFLHSHDEKSGHHISVEIENGFAPVVQWDPLSGKKSLLNVKERAGHIEFAIDIEAEGSAVISMGLDVGYDYKSEYKQEIVNTNEIRGPFEIILYDMNCIPLDYCRYSIKLGALSSKVPTIKADKDIRDYFGLGSRIGIEHQPWYLTKKGLFDLKTTDRVKLKYDFYVGELPEDCMLAIESSENIDIKINGQKADKPKGHWLDKDFEVIDISSKVHLGDNEILLESYYTPDWEIEAIYLLGKFGVATRSNSTPAPDNITVVSAPIKLDMGSWVDQKLCFYSGSVGYKILVEKPLEGQRTIIQLPDLVCTAAAIHVGTEVFCVPWAPFEADITDALKKDINEVIVEIIGGRANVLGPLHVPWTGFTSPGCFSPEHSDYTFEYQTNGHGLYGPILINTVVSVKI